jgi:hypothetical protein
MSGDAPMTLREMRVELRELGSDLDRLSAQMSGLYSPEPFVEPKPLPAIADDVEMIAADLVGWAARARKER